MFKLSVERPKKLNTIKTIILLYFTVISVLLLTACSKGFPTETAVSVEQETVKVIIKTPSDVESTIAPGRHFKVSGSLSGEIPDDAILRVTLLDAAGKEMRYAAADELALFRYAGRRHLKSDIRKFIEDETNIELRSEEWT